MGGRKKKGFPVAFWVCACSEIFERLAYYLGRSLILIFVTASVATGNSDFRIRWLPICSRT